MLDLSRRLGRHSHGLPRSTRGTAFYMILGFIAPGWLPLRYLHTSLSFDHHHFFELTIMQSISWLLIRHSASQKRL